MYTCVFIGISRTVEGRRGLRRCKIERETENSRTNWGRERTDWRGWGTERAAGMRGMRTKHNIHMPEEIRPDMHIYTPPTL